MSETEQIDPARRVIAATLNDLDAALTARAQIRPEWIGHADGRRIFECIAKLAAQGEEATVPAVAKLWAQIAEEDFIACGQRLVAYLDCAFGAKANIHAYARLLREDYERRRIGVAALEISEEAHDWSSDPQELSDAMKDAARLAAPPSARVIREDQVQPEADGGRPVLPTGFADLDRLLKGGLKGGELVTIAGRTSMGKSAFMLDLVRNLSNDGCHVAIVSVEMTPAMLSGRLRVIPPRPEAVPPWIINGTESSPTLEQVAAEAFDLQHQGLACLAIDYLQILKLSRAENRNLQIAEAMRALKELAVQLDVPIILLSQLKRSDHERRDSEPQLSDLRDSGSIEEGSDVVMLLHRPGYYDPAADQSAALLKVAKHREGATGRIRLVWRPHLSSFAGYAVNLGDSWIEGV